MKKYSIFITDTSQSGSMRRFSFSATQLRIGIGVLILLILGFGIGALDYTLAVSRQAELKQLRAENVELNRHIQLISEKTEDLELTLQRIEDFSTKLKFITHRGDSYTAMGPLPYHISSDSFEKWSESSVPRTFPADEVKKKAF